jgi:hypothetical protein
MAGYTLTYANKGVRNLPLSPEVAEIYRKAAEAAGIGEIRVTSGGQEASGPNRTGSHRHDLGGAGDIQLVADGRVLNFTDPKDLPVISKFVSAAKAAGATGIGAGTDYMGPNTLHVGLGSPSVWGAGGKGANAPEWLQKAYGTTLNSNPVAVAEAAAPAATTEETPKTWDQKVASLAKEEGGLDDIVKAMAAQRESQAAAIAANSQITPPSFAGAAPSVDPAAAQALMAQLMQPRRKKFGMSLMG